MAKQVDAVYGNALYEAALEENKLRVLLDEAREVRNAIEQNEDLVKLFGHPGIDLDDKLKVITECFDGKCDDLITGTLLMAVKKGHGANLVKILNFFIQKARDHEGIGVAYVYSAIPLSDEKKEQIHDRLTSTTKYKDMRIHFRVDESLIGGLVVKIGDRIVDTSIKTKLDSLTKSLL